MLADRPRHGLGTSQNEMATKDTQAISSNHHRTEMNNEGKPYVSTYSPTPARSSVAVSLTNRVSVASDGAQMAGWTRRHGVSAIRLSYAPESSWNWWRRYVNSAKAQQMLMVVEASRQLSSFSFFSSNRHCLAYVVLLVGRSSKN